MALKIKDLLHEKQYEVYTSLEKFKVLMWGRRSGKSHLVCHLTLKYIALGNKTCWIVAPTANDADEIYSDTLREIIKLYGWGEPGKLQFNKNCQYEIKDRGLLYQFRNGSKLYLKSSDRQDRLKGRDIDFIALDEFINFEKKEKWSSIYLPLLNPAGKMIIISTPAEHYDEFYRIYELGQTGNKNWKSWKATSLVNDKFQGVDENGKIITLKEKIAVDSQFMPREQYLREYFCEFGKTTNKCAHDFDRDLHSFKLPIIFPDKPLLISCDFNTNPMCWVLIQKIDSDTLINLFPEITTYKVIENDKEVIKERKLQKEVLCYIKSFKIPHTSTEKVIPVVKDYIQSHLFYDGTKIWYGDATGKNRTGVTDDTHWSLIRNSFKEDIYKYKKANPYHPSRISATNAKVLNANGEIGILMDIERCKDLIKDFETARKTDDGWIDKKYYDPHLYDAATYIIETDYPIIIERKQNKKIFQFANLDYLFDDDNTGGLDLYRNESFQPLDIFGT